MISHLDEERALNFIKTGIRRHAILKKDGSVKVSEEGTVQAITNIKRHAYQMMKKYANNPEILKGLVKGLEQALKEQNLNRADAQNKGD